MKAELGRLEDCLADKSFELERLKKEGEGGAAVDSEAFTQLREEVCGLRNEVALKTQLIANYSAQENVVNSLQVRCILDPADSAILFFWMVVSCFCKIS